MDEQHRNPGEAQQDDSARPFPDGRLPPGDRPPHRLAFVEKAQHVDGREKQGRDAQHRISDDPVRCGPPFRSSREPRRSSHVKSARTARLRRMAQGDCGRRRRPGEFGPRRPSKQGHQMQTQAQSPARLVYLDWIRVAAFGLLILYHVGMFYVTWDWHVKSDHAGHAIEPLDAAHQSLAADPAVPGLGRRDPLHGRQDERRRARREAQPCACSCRWSSPCSSWCRRKAITRWSRRSAIATGYLAFWGRYLAADPGFCDADGCLDVPTWNHLWFVAYLLVYTLLLAALLAPVPRAADPPGRQAGGAARRRLLLIGPIAWLAAARLLLLARCSRSPMVSSTIGTIMPSRCPLSCSAFWRSRTVGSRRSFVRLRWLALALFSSATRSMPAMPGPIARRMRCRRKRSAPRCESSTRSTNGARSSRLWVSAPAISPATAGCCAR